MTTHLNKGRHVRLLHGLNGRLHQRYGGLQLVAAALDERASSFELVVLLLADEPHQLQLPLLQGRHQPVKMAGQLFSLLPSILLGSEVRGRISAPSQSELSVQLTSMAWHISSIWEMCSWTWSLLATSMAISSLSSTCGKRGST